MTNLIDYAARFNYSEYMERRNQAHSVHVDIALWKESHSLLNELHSLPPFRVELTPHLKLTPATPLTEEQSKLVEEAARSLIPWRTGPFEIDKLFIDAEWNSTFKWQRIAEELQEIDGEIIADVGCNNGFFMYQLARHNPSFIMGFDPSGRCHLQFQFLQQLAKIPNMIHTPLEVADLDLFPEFFHKIMCMGVIYHRRDPLSMLRVLKNALRPKGTCIIESLIIPGGESHCLFPKERFAKMKNVFFVPTLACLMSWMERINFSDIRVLDVSPLTSKEQRKTPFAPYESLEEFKDGEKTAEGYPWPLRATVVGTKSH